MKRIIVIGCTGSGKSTFSRKLGRIINIGLCHLDLLYWNSDMTRVSEDIFLERLNKALRADSFIIDGDYINSLELRMKIADTIFFLDYPAEVAMLGVEDRTGKKRSDLPFIETEAVHTEGFYKHIRMYNTIERPIVIELLNKYSDKDIHIFKNRDEANSYLRALYNKINNK